MLTGFEKATAQFLSPFLAVARSERWSAGQSSCSQGARVRKEVDNTFCFSIYCAGSLAQRGAQKLLNSGVGGKGEGVSDHAGERAAGEQHPNNLQVALLAGIK